MIPLSLLSFTLCTCSPLQYAWLLCLSNCLATHQEIQNLLSFAALKLCLAQVEPDLPVLPYLWLRSPAEQSLCE